METSQQMSYGAGVGGDPGQFAGMSKQQLYDIMSQMKTLIDNDQDHAREVLIGNPVLTRALFQAQIMLGMVKDPKDTPKVVTDIKQVATQSQPVQDVKPPLVQNMPPPAVQHQPRIQDHITLPRPPLVPKQENIAETSRTFFSTPNPTMPYQPPAMPANHPPSSQLKAFHLPQHPSVATPQSSQHVNVTLPQLPPQYSTFPSQAPVVSSQQQPLKSHVMYNQQMQPPLPQGPRPISVPSFHHQAEVHNHISLHPSSVPQQLLQSVYHASGNPHAPYLTTQPPLPTQPPPQHLYQGGSHMSVDYNSQAGNSMQIDRSASAPWSRVHQETPATGTNFPGQPTHSAHGMGGSQAQAPQPQKLTAEMENGLIQQVLSMTPEQVSLLPPEQRQQVFQLKEMLLRSSG